jgi:hypothetical protein
MPHFWLTYRDGVRLIGVVIDEAPSLIQARLKAAVRSIDRGAPFATGHLLGAELVALVPPTQIGRMLSGAEAAKLLARFEGLKHRRPDRRPRSAGAQATISTERR